MYGPKWPFLLMYGSHDMRHTGFPPVDGLSTDPRDLGRHKSNILPLGRLNHNSNVFLIDLYNHNQLYTINAPRGYINRT